MLKALSTRIFIAAASMSVAWVPVSAQVQTVDPNDAIDADLKAGTPNKTAGPDQAAQERDLGTIVNDVANESDIQADLDPAAAAEQDTTVNADGAPADQVADPATGQDGTTYQQDDLIGAAEGVFGKGAEGLGSMIESILKKQGRPNAYIAGREAGGALVVGLRYGSGTLYHKIEGQRPVYWTGPSVGFDAGANAGNTFVLVYNLYDGEDLYKRFGAGEGAAYFVGGFHASYLRRGDVVLIPVRLGVGLRLGANVGYMKFSKKRRWLPF